MAGPTVSESLYNTSTNQLTIKWSAASTYQGAAGDIQFTAADAATVWRSTAAPISGDTTATHVYQLSLNPTGGTPGTANSFTIAASMVASAGGNSGAISATTAGIAIDHAAPYNRTDVLALDTVTSNLLNNLYSSYTSLQITDAGNLRGHLTGTSGNLSLAPRLGTQAQALLTQLGKFLNGSRDKFSENELIASISSLQAAMPKQGQTFPFAITAAGT